MAEENTFALLRKSGAEISKAICIAAARRRITPSEACYSLAHDVAVGLQLIDGYLDSLQPYWIELEVEELCHSLLQDLLHITTPPKSLSSSAQFPPLPLLSFPSSRPKLPDLETRLLKFFRTQTTSARKLKSTCDELRVKLTKDDAENDTQAVPESALKQFTTSDISAYFNNGVFNALELISKCNPESHENAAEHVWHPARLCFDDTEVGIRILVSASTETGDWQEFCVRFQPESPRDHHWPVLKHVGILEQGGFCDFLERELTARVFLSFLDGRGFKILGEPLQVQQMLQAGRGQSLAAVLRQYDLKPKDKVSLASAIARAYWQYYDSDLMRTRWTSDTIWFMPEKGRKTRKDQLPLCAYLSFPFGSPNAPSKDIFLEDLLTHRCPRIFDVGVLLLEIGLGEKFKTGKKRDLVAQLNLNHKIATDSLDELEKATWDGFLNKKVFDQAVKFCLHSKNFIKAVKKPKASRMGELSPPEPMTAEEQKRGVIERRKIFYRHVVQPLAWLARKGFKMQPGDITYVSKKRAEPQTEPAYTAQQLDGEHLFHSAIVPKMWLEDIKKISQSVELKRRAKRISTPIRVAILDTGLNMDLPIFKERPGLKRAIKDRVDYVDPGASTMTDTFGHGTLMARVVMECAPGVEILVARVARNTKELMTSQENIRKAILWAGQPGKADIIFTSFGISRKDEGGIGEAIETLERERNEDIIFLASAGNSDTDDESFPACHSSVVAVYATDKHGAPVSSNAASPGQNTWVLGTYGDPPDALRAEFADSYPGICEAGSSIATAAMAGISAVMLAYATALPSLVELRYNHVLKRLWTSKGMEALLYRLAPESKAHPWFRAVKPPVFWKNKADDSLRYCVFVDTQSEVERLSPRRPRAPAKKTESQENKASLVAVEEVEGALASV
ncbi:hypothetical protein B0T24DRAFT_616793 [Lasiosphaeria ovina]|uniref:Peptidase S8/S53 domain-containing protein n=1 Tax=Lasiosphaeria ovina TaxID=92902 RepID=A0AAE0KGA2_9PEZI|nr:hypothetical protein B0T24DRAFT_616793 [Lasiosphaeria ovina]